MIKTAILAVLIGAGAAYSSDSSTADLLEKGIYTEETVGDLESAIEIYARVVGHVEGERPHAAKALYRMALCYQKIGDASQAEATFRKLVNQYADQADFVALAQAHLPDSVSILELGSIPWEDGEESHMVFQYPNGKPIGKVISAIERRQVEGRDVWHVQMRRMFGPTNRGITNCLVDAESFKPIRTEVYHSVLGNLTADFKDGSATLWREGSDDPQHLSLPSGPFENDVVGFVFRRLPLEVGYTDRVPIFPTFTGQQVDLGVDVAEIDTVTTPAGVFPSYRLDLSINQRAWISVDTRQSAQAEVSGLVGRLTEVVKRRRSESRVFGNDLVSVHLPPDWAIFDSGPGLDRLATLELQDPKAAIISGIQVMRVEKEKSLADRMDAVIQHNVHAFGTYEVIERAATENSGHFLAALEYDRKPAVHVRHFILTDKVYVKILFLIPKDQLEAQRPVLEEIVQRLKVL